jgi:hypothetical protein
MDGQSVSSAPGALQSEVHTFTDFDQSADSALHCNQLGSAVMVLQVTMLYAKLSRARCHEQPVFFTGAANGLLIWWPLQPLEKLQLQPHQGFQHLKHS